MIDETFQIKIRFLIKKNFYVYQITYKKLYKRHRLAIQEWGVREVFFVYIPENFEMVVGKLRI